MIASSPRGWETESDIVVEGATERDEWRIEIDVVVRAARKDIIAERGTRSDVLWKEEEKYAVEEEGLR